MRQMLAQLLGDPYLSTHKKPPRAHFLKLFFFFFLNRCFTAPG